MEKKEGNLLKSKKIIIMILVLMLILILILVINIIPKDVDKILINNDYEFKDMHEAGSGDEVITFSRNTYSYKKGDVSILVYEYNNFAEIKNEILEIYESLKDNNDYDITFDDKDNYTYMRSCDVIVCDYYLGYDMELVSTSVVLENKEETDKVFNEILKGKKLI